MPWARSERSGTPVGAVVRNGPAQPVVWLCLLGGFRLIAGGQPVRVRSGGKTEALLVHLGLAGCRGLPRGVLLRALWPHSEPGLAGQALNSLVHSLKALLVEVLGGADPILPSDGTYRLNNAAGLAVDVAQFQTLVAQGEQLQRHGQVAAAAAVYERAVRLYRGDLSPAAGNSSRVALERERLGVTYRRVLIRLADGAFAREKFEESLGHALALLEHDPCREDAHRLVMRCHLRLGERSQALRHYRTVQEILRAELDAEPETATTALFEQIRLNRGAM